MIADQVLVRLIQILIVPQYFPQLIWLILPLFFGLVMIQMYFGRYKTEQIGWNTAYANTVSLIWVCFILLKFMSDEYGIQAAWGNQDLRGHLLMIASLALLTFVLIVMNYHHLLPKKLAFVMSSAIPTTILAYLSIVIIMGRIPLDEATIWAGIIIWLATTVVFKIYRYMITPPKDVQYRLEKKQEKDKKEFKKVERNIKRKVQQVIPLGVVQPKKKTKLKKKASVKRKTSKKRK